MAEYYIVMTDNTTIPFNKVSTSFSGYDGTANNNATFLEPLDIGGNIPVYEYLRNGFTADFDYSDLGNGGWVQTGTNRYEWGVVLATTEPKTHDGLDYVGALVVSLISSTPLTKEERIANVNNGYFINTTGEGADPWYFGTPYLCLKYVRYNETYDYSKFIFGVTPSDTSSYGKGAWTQYDAYGASSTYKPALFETGYSHKRLANYSQWVDGVADPVGGLVLAMPLYFEYNNSYTCTFIHTRIINSDALLPYTDLEHVELDKRYGINRRDAVEFDYSSLENHGFNFLTDFHSGLEPIIPPDYPFEDDYNGGGGGTGDYRDTSDTIPFDGTPSISALSSGFVDAYLLTPQQVIDFHNYLYSTDFLDNVKKLISDPIDYIIALMLAPYTPDTSTTHSIMIGGTNSEVTASVISSGYKTVDCGTITLSEFWGKFYDYNPYTKVQIYLPFIGMRPLDIDDVMAGEVNLKYRIDVLTGACVATISVNNARGTNGAVYNFNGNCHSHIPVSGKNYLETVTNVMQAGLGMAGSIASGNALGVASGAINVMRSAKEQLEHAGELTGATGLLANYTPFLMVSRPSQSLAQNYNHYHGFISNVTAQLGTLTGYTEVSELVQTNIHCTLDEFEEINDLLKSGVYL